MVERQAPDQSVRRVHNANAGWFGLAASYFGYFGLLGTLQPYLANLYLEHGLQADVVGGSVALLYILAGLAPLAATAAGAHFQLGAKKTFLASATLVVGFASTLAWVGPQLSNFAYALLICCLTAAHAPLNVLLDTSAVRACNASGWSFGRLRLMGSLGYIFTATLMGRILPTTQISASVHLAVATLASTVLLSGFFLPDAQVAGRASGDGRQVTSGTLAPSRGTLICLLAALGLHYASFGPFQYGFTLYGQSVGLAPSAIGLGWSLGVASEVGVFLLAGPLLQRWGWRWPLLASFVAAPLRWILLAAFPHPVTFFASQLMHGPAFALFVAAGMAALSEVLPQARARRSQTLYSALVAGLASGPSMLAAGYAYAYFPLGTMFACVLPTNLLALALLAVVLRRAKEFTRLAAVS